MTDDFLEEMVRDRAQERERRLKWARETAAAFAGLRFEAVLLGIRDNAFITWNDTVRSAKLAQLDIEEAELRKRHTDVRRRANDALAGCKGLVNMAWARAWDRYEKLSKEQRKLEDRQEQIWKRRQELISR